MLINIGKLRNSLRLTQKEFAKILRINRTELLILELENKEINVSEESLRELGYTTEEEIKEEVVKVIEVIKDNYSPELKMIEMTNYFLNENGYSSECVVTEETMFYMARKVIGQRIRETREKKNIGIREIISTMKLTESMYWNHESGRTRLYPTKVKNLAILFGIPEIVLNERLVILEQDLLVKEIRRKRL
jgi:transcriptional regulator with XRE-family HTH domain